MPRESAASSNPQRDLHFIGASDYWIARSSRAMTRIDILGDPPCA